jgi:DNA mismatch endonuclease (patch repair protein)
LKKLESNVIRDKQVKSDLELLGWRVITVWECELREPDHLAGRLGAGLISEFQKYQT